VRAPAFLIHQKVATLGDLWSWNKGNSAFPAACGDPKLCLAREEFHLGDFVLNPYGSHICIVINQSASEKVVDLDFTSFESHEQKLDIDVTTYHLDLLFLDSVDSVVIIFCLIDFGDLVVTSFDEVASLADVGCAVPNSHHEVGVNCIKLELDLVHYHTYKSWVLTCKHSSVVFNSTW